MSTPHTPDLSVVLVTPDTYETIRTTVRHLVAQTVRDRIELVLVTPNAEALQPDQADLERFGAFQIVEVETIRSIAGANAAGVRRARAPVVALAEDHAFPAPEWAGALLAAHRKPYTVVGPAIHNANPESVVSWADLLIAYAPWLYPAPGGPRDHLPGHNSSYKREVLLAQGAHLETALDAETVFHWTLRGQGHQLYLEPAAQLYHMNFGRMASWLPAQFYSARVFAASRAESWSLAKRALYGLLAPCIPLVRFRRILTEVQASGCWSHLPTGVFPTLLVGLFVSALGEMIGYVGGPGEAKEKVAEYEFHRVQHLGKQKNPLPRVVTVANH